ncbi:DUF4251 domain-containing protein [Mucilaginibacter sp. PAMB04274]|uniref:DUF4251 domain-containing protein n=1 Tax=Mucilaginibacter sp. PAMB04274 TaxID=3138568 RepID=UPI0031F5F118
MKTLKYIFIIALFLLAGNTYAQDTVRKTSRAERQEMKAAEVRQLLESKKFVFQAQYANPLGGGVTTLNGRLFNLSPNGNGHIYLNYNYDFKIRPDSVISYLPYYGRATFDAAYNSPNDNGVMFTSTKFGYSAKAGKKGNTVITITPRDAKYNQKFILEVTDSGTATLQAIITNRNTISYDGYITEK